MGNNQRQLCFEFLCSDVLTLSQVAEMWGKNKSTVFNAILTGRLASVKRGKAVLVSARSAVNLWGKIEGYE